MFRHPTTAISVSALAALFGFLAAAGPAGATAATGDDLPEVNTQIGGYLAGRLARGLNDRHAAAAYYGLALV